MAHPLVTIVIDNHNYARYVGAAIESALAQTYQPIEIIVVDDGSTDGSRAVIAAYAGRITIIFQNNRGQSGAFNTGYAASSGDIVMFLDSDDLLRPERSPRSSPTGDPASPSCNSAWRRSMPRAPSPAASSRTIRRR